MPVQVGGTEIFMKKLRTIPMWLIFAGLLAIKAFAYDYPNDFWTVNSAYEAALNSNNYSDIIRYGNEIIDIMKSAADGREKRDITVIRYNEIAKAYAALGNYSESAGAYNRLYNYASRYGDEYYDYKKAAKAYALQYTPRITMYTDNGVQTYYRAKNEKQNGVLFGICANGKSNIENPSMILAYQELGQSESYIYDILRNAKSKGIAVELALNCPNEGSDIRNIRSMASNLGKISDALSRYDEVPVYLRFAAEFDIWTNTAQADEFREAFRYVSRYFKDRNDNVAIVWSPNHVSSWNIDIDDYYPGDEYVDWVGMSLYTQPYFLGDRNQKDEYQAVFKTGRNSDPVLAVKEIVEKYGGRKPIMLAESGCAHTLMSTGESTAAFALRRLKEQYAYLPMIYPQIKLIAYFDWYVNGEKYDYRLSDNSEMLNEYKKLVNGGRFIRDRYDSDTDFCYREVSEGITLGSVFPVSCYAHKYNAEPKRVTYFIDDNYAGVATEIPYTAYIDASRYSGRHVIKAVALFDDGQTAETRESVNISGGNNDITVKISGERISFDRTPVIYNSRTLVPMRKIFEELGADVDWNGSTGIATGTRGGRRVKLTIGSKLMYVNNKEIELDTSPIVMSDRTLVPVRAVAEGLGCDVDWIGGTSTVEIEPKVFEWSEWTEELPDYVDSDLYYIEESAEYRYRTRELEYFTSRLKYPYDLVRVDTEYGEWSGWQRDYISESEDTEVETRTQSSPVQYHFAHYCTGNIADKANRYMTSAAWWHDACLYHDIGWYDHLLNETPDGKGGYVLYNDDGSYKRCSNTCYRYYVVETSGGDYTEYRSRKKYKTYVYKQWSDWSEWSDWSREYRDYDNRTDVSMRTIYRYKEK